MVTYFRILPFPHGHSPTGNSVVSEVLTIPPDFIQPEATQVAAATQTAQCPALDLQCKCITWDGMMTQGAGYGQDG